MEGVATALFSTHLEGHFLREFWRQYIQRRDNVTSAEVSLRRLNDTLQPNLHAASEVDGLSAYVADVLDGRQMLFTSRAFDEVKGEARHPNGMDTPTPPWTHTHKKRRENRSLGLGFFEGA